MCDETTDPTRATRSCSEPFSPAELADALKTALLLPSEPVGVRVFTEEAVFRAWEAPHPEEPLYYCAAVGRATVGESLKLSREDISCDTSPRTLGLEPGFFDDDFLESYVKVGLYRDRQVADAVLADVATLERTAGLAVGPLAGFTTAEPPDVVIIATTPYGVMRVTQAAAFGGRLVRGSAIGMHGICAESTAAPLKTGEITASFLCSGTRHVAGWDEHLMSVGIPYMLLAEVVSGLLATAERYENDDRKGRLRAACRRSSTCGRGLAAGLQQVTDGGGYFLPK